MTKKRRGFCKYHNFLDHKTSQCVLFRVLVQKDLKEGKLQFGEKPKTTMKVDSNPIQTKDSHYAEHMEILMVEATEGFKEEADKGEQIFVVVNADMQ